MSICGGVCACICASVQSSSHLQDALPLALGPLFSSHDGVTVSADLVHLVTVVLQGHLVVGAFPAYHLIRIGVMEMSGQSFNLYITIQSLGQT